MVTLDLYDRHAYQAEDPLISFAILVLHILPSLITNMLVIGDSVEYVGAQMLTLTFHVCFNSFKVVSVRGYIWTYIKVILLSLTIFICNER